MANVRALRLAKRLIVFAALLLFSIQPAPAQNTETNPQPAVTSPHRSGFVTANGIKLQYLDWGGAVAGGVLLLLTGLGDDAHVFDDFAPKFTDRFRVIALTRRGFGESDKPATGYDIATRVEDIRQFLDALKIAKVSIVGHSMAGDEMTSFATLYPRRVEKLVYLEAAYDRTHLPDFITTDPGMLPVWKRLNLEAQGSPEAATIAVNDMPPAETWEIYKAVTKAMIAFQPDYTKVEAPALAIYATPAHRPSIPAQADEATRRLWDEWWVKNFVPFQRASIEQFRREAIRGQVVEMNDATHYVFRGPTAGEVVRRTRAFLSQ